MKNFRSVCFKCSIEDFEKMKPKLIELGCQIKGIDYFNPFFYLNNYYTSGELRIYNTDTRPTKTEEVFTRKDFLKACGYKKKKKKKKKSIFYMSTYILKSFAFCFLLSLVSTAIFLLLKYIFE